MAGAFFRPREKRVSHICVWRYVRPFVRNNNYSVCNCNRIGGFARDDGLPQHLAGVSLGLIPTLPTTSSLPLAITFAPPSPSLLPPCGHFAFCEIALLQYSKGISPRCMIYYRGQMIMSLRLAPPLDGLRDYSFDQSVMLLSRIGAMSGRVKMSKFLLTVCAFGLLLSFAFAEEKSPEQHREESN